MGNRAVLTTKDYKFGIYLHWNGGRDSVNAFLCYCDARGYRPPESDDYGWAALCGVLCVFNNFEGLSIGFDNLTNLDCDNGDNGVYIIKDWHVIGREFMPSKAEQDAYDLKEFVHQLNDNMPPAAKMEDEELDRKIEEWKTAEEKITPVVHYSKHFDVD